MFGFLKRKKKEPESVETLSPLPAHPPLPAESLAERNEIVLREIDTLRTQTQLIDERLKNVERMISELYRMAKES